MCYYDQKQRRETQQHYASSLSMLYPWFVHTDLALNVEQKLPEEQRLRYVVLVQKSSQELQQIKFWLRSSEDHNERDDGLFDDDDDTNEQVMVMSMPMSRTGSAESLVAWMSSSGKYHVGLN